MSPCQPLLSQNDASNKGEGARRAGRTQLAVLSAWPNDLGYKGEGHRIDLSGDLPTPF